MTARRYEVFRRGQPVGFAEADNPFGLAIEMFRLPGMDVDMATILYFAADAWEAGNAYGSGPTRVELVGDQK